MTTPARSRVRKTEHGWVTTWLDPRRQVPVWAWHPSWQRAVDTANAVSRRYHP